MPNPLLQQVLNSNVTNEISKLASIVKGFQNPQSIINSNPQLKAILAMYKGDAKTAFYSLCKQRGINPDSILSQLK